MRPSRSPRIASPAAVRPRSRRRPTRPAAGARRGAESETDVTAAKDERKRRRGRAHTALGADLAVGHLGTRRPLEHRVAEARRSPRPSPCAGRRRGTSRLNAMRWQSTGTISRSTSAGTTNSRPAEQCQRPGGMLERERAAHRGPIATPSRSRVARTRRRSSAGSGRRRRPPRTAVWSSFTSASVTTGLQPLQRMAVDLVADDLQLVVVPRVAE